MTLTLACSAFSARLHAVSVLHRRIEEVLGERLGELHFGGVESLRLHLLHRAEADILAFSTELCQSSAAARILRVPQRHTACNTPALRGREGDRIQQLQRPCVSRLLHRLQCLDAQLDSLARDLLQSSQQRSGVPSVQGHSGSLHIHEREVGRQDPLRQALGDCAGEARHGHASAISRDGYPQTLVDHLCDRTPGIRRERGEQAVRTSALSPPVTGGRVRHVRHEDLAERTDQVAEDLGRNHQPVALQCRDETHVLGGHPLNVVTGLAERVPARRLGLADPLGSVYKLLRPQAPGREHLTQPCRRRAERGGGRRLPHQPGRVLDSRLQVRHGDLFEDLVRSRGFQTAAQINPRLRAASLWWAEQRSHGVRLFGAGVGRRDMRPEQHALDHMVEVRAERSVEQYRLARVRPLSPGESLCHRRRPRQRHSMLREQPSQDRGVDRFLRGHPRADVGCHRLHQGPETRKSYSLRRMRGIDDDAPIRYSHQGLEVMPRHGHDVEAAVTQILKVVLSVHPLQSGPSECPRRLRSTCPEQSSEPLSRLIRRLDYQDSKLPGQRVRAHLVLCDHIGQCGENLTRTGLENDCESGSRQSPSLPAQSWPQQEAPPHASAPTRTASTTTRLSTRSGRAAAVQCHRIRRPPRASWCSGDQSCPDQREPYAAARPRSRAGLPDGRAGGQPARSPPP